MFSFIINYILKELAASEAAALWHDRNVCVIIIIIVFINY